MHVLDRTRAALEIAADKILADYRTWVADDTEAKPHYGQIPEYDAVNSAVGEIDSWLTMRGATGAWQRCGLDSDALEVAINAVYCAAMGGDANIENHAAIAIRAYLSAPLPADAAELVERLEDVATNAIAENLAHNAASLIQSQAARIAVLEASVEHKNAALDAAFAYLEGSNPLHASGGHRNTDLRDKVRTARALLNRRAEG